MERSTMLTSRGALCVAALVLALVVTLVAAERAGVGPSAPRPDSRASGAVRRSVGEVNSRPGALGSGAATVGDAAGHEVAAADADAADAEGASRDEPPAASRPEAEGAPAPARGSIPPGAVSVLPDVGLSAPEAYRCEADVLGWQDAAGDVVCLRVLSAEPAGAIDPIDGSELGEVSNGGSDHSARLTSLSILASVPGATLQVGARRAVRIILFPSGTGATFFVDGSAD